MDAHISTLLASSNSRDFTTASRCCILSSGDERPIPSAEAIFEDFLDALVEGFFLAMVLNVLKQVRESCFAIYRDMRHFLVVSCSAKSSVSDLN